MKPLPKRITTALLSAALVLLPCHRAPAPGPAVGLALALKCIFFTGTVATGYILHKCGAEYWLCVTSVEVGEDPEWFVSQGTRGTLAKTGARRCRGPFRDRTDPDLMAKVNNANSVTNKVPVFLCIPSAPLPGSPPRPVRMSLEQSTDGGNSWAGIASLVTDSDETCPFGLLPASGTSGLSRARLMELSGCSMLVTNAASAAPSAWHRVRYEEP
jgi:hypothetical protein